MAACNSISLATVPTARTARAHLRGVYAAEKAIRERLDAIPFVTVGSESCNDLLRILSHLEAASALLDTTADREVTRFERAAV